MGLHASSMSSAGSGLVNGTDYFFALLPEDQVRAEIASVSDRFRNTHRLIGNQVDASRFHMTLCPAGRPGRMRGSVEAALIEAAGQVRVKVFDMILESAMRLSAKDGQYPFVLCTDSLSGDSALTLRKAIALAQAKAGLSVPGVSSYMPHVTLLHGPMIDAIEVSMPSIHWRVREFVLVRSFFGQSRNEVVGRWPLDPAY